jgi:PAS domain S-box-containing protein
MEVTNQDFMPGIQSFPGKPEQPFSVFAPLLDSLPFGAFLLDGNGNFLVAGRRFRQLMHQTDPAWPAGLHFSDLLQEVPQAYSQREFRTGVRAAEASRVRFLRQDGVAIEVLLSLTPLPAGSETWWFGQIKEVKVANPPDHIIKSMDARLFDIIDHAPFGIVQISQVGKVLFWNKTAEQIFGYSAAEVLGRPITMILVPKTAIHHARKLWKKMLTQKKTLQVVLEGKKQDGKIIFCEWSLTPILDQDGSVYSIIGLVSDLTHRREIEKALKQTEKRFKKFLDNDISGDFISTPDRGPIYCNKRFLEIFGFTSYDEFLNFDYMKLYKDPKDREKLYDRLQKDGKVENYEIEMLDKNGNVKIIIENSVAEFDENGKMVAVYGNCLDVTEHHLAERKQRELEAQLHHAQKLEAIGRMAAGVAHDFNNMISIILASAQMAQMDLPEEHPIRPLLEEIQSAAERSAEFTRHLLTFARKQPADPVPVDLNEIIRQNQKMLRRLVGEDIELNVHLTEDLWYVKMDPAQVDQILTNLAVNARDAIRSTGTITIETRNLIIEKDYSDYHSLAGPGHYVLLQFGDTGSGIPKEIINKIFDPFFTTKAPSGGTGLGLSTVYGIVKQNGGFITVYSEPDVGTVFKIFLPRHSEPEPEEPKEEIQDVPRGKETILIVEDEAKILRICERYLQRLGYRVIALNHPEKALSAVQQMEGCIDLLLTDVIMPGMNGYELARRLREMCPGMKTLYMSGYTWDIISDRGFLDQDIHFVSKPFNLEELAREIRSTIDG